MSTDNDYYLSLLDYIQKCQELSILKNDEYRDKDDSKDILPYEKNKRAIIYYFNVYKMENNDEEAKKWARLLLRIKKMRS